MMWKILHSWKIHSLLEILLLLNLGTFEERIMLYLMTHSGKIYIYIFTSERIFMFINVGIPLFLTQ